MPTLTLRPALGCVVCRCRVRGFRIGTFRINKGSLVSARGNLVFVEATCPECGHPTGHPLDMACWRLDEESQAVVDAHRARKGWH